MAKKMYFNARKMSFQIYQGTGKDLIHIPNNIKVELEEDIAERYPSWFKVIDKEGVLELEIAEEGVENNEFLSECDETEQIDDVDDIETETSNETDIEKTNKETAIDPVTESSEPKELESESIEECSIKIDVEKALSDVNAIRVKGVLNEYAEKLGINLDTTKTLKQMKEDFEATIKG